MRVTRVRPAALLIPVVGVGIVLAALGERDRRRADHLQRKAREELEALGEVVTLFRVDAGRDPESLADLWERPATWTGRFPYTPYVTEYPPTDPWGNPYLLRRADVASASSATVELVSRGADGQLGGADDLSTSRP